VASRSTCTLDNLPLTYDDRGLISHRNAEKLLGL